ncbi:hypothetical protein EST38_g463 [Candolleomyces aberdarensis]|uniref:Nephrocystin 3-like N-terminal domain-containing protein n=1 Tax=Candolleomyces aberdarensis TaxID=2316362 RepID=A0A4Q2DYB9_9AGAR|nr:hypothetical protein EST38_g463 [Candolleomyces aberdarensis]
MAENPPASARVETFSNAHDFQIGVQNNHIVHRNQYISNDQATLIQLLQPILDASHTRDREKSPPNSACFPGTRIDVIRTIVAWADSSLLWNTHVLWLYGFVGCGKSAIALQIALIFEGRKRLVGSYFFFRNTGDRSRMTRFATTLACQLAAAIPEATPFIERALKTGPGLLQWNLAAQLRHLVYEPFKAAVWSGRLLWTTLLNGPFLIVIDGLDECEDRRDVEAFIDDMLDFFKKNPFVPLRFLITSRVEQHIQGHLGRDQVRFENLVNHCSRNDIDIFMRACFEAEQQRNPVIKAYIRTHGDWPAKKDRDRLVNHIGGSFIFASALFKYIVDPTATDAPMDRLPHTLNMNPGLNTLYAETLSRSQHLPHFHGIISTLALTFEPLSIIGIAELLGIESFEVVRVLVDLQAIIHIPGTDDLPVTMCHTSLRDFLKTKSPPSYHLHLAYRCYTLHAEQPDTAAALYSIRYFAEHIQKQLACLPPTVQGPISRFPQTLDALYAHILAKSENDPHFPDIISTIVLLRRPCLVSRISQLLGIETSKVVRFLVNLQPIITIPDTDDLPVTMCHISVRQFLTTESRSGRFFISPSYHLTLSYKYFNLNLEWLPSPTPSSPVVIRSIECRYESLSHWENFLKTISEPTVYDELDQLTDRPSQTSSYRHIFSFTRLFLWAFQGGDHGPGQILLTLTRCIESLALALECDHAPVKWLQSPSFDEHTTSSGVNTNSLGFLKVHQEQAMALQQNVQRVEAAITAKGLSHLLEHSWNPNVDTIRMDSLLSRWTVMDAFLLLKWIAAHAQAGMNPVRPGVAHALGLDIAIVSRGSHKVDIIIRPYTQPPAT